MQVTTERRRTLERIIFNTIVDYIPTAAYNANLKYAVREVATKVIEEIATWKKPRKKSGT